MNFQDLPTDPPPPSRPHSTPVVFRKTQLCRFNEAGRCRYSSACLFAHGLDELQEQPDLSKTSLCKSWLQGRCEAASDQCTFAHGKGELRKTPLHSKKNKKNMSSRGHGKVSDYRDFSAGIGETHDSESTFDASPMMKPRSLESSAASKVDDGATSQVLAWDPLGYGVSDHAVRAPSTTLSEMTLRLQHMNWDCKIHQQDHSRKQGESNSRSDHNQEALGNLSRSPGYLNNDSPSSDYISNLAVAGQMGQATSVICGTLQNYGNNPAELVEILKQAMPLHYDD
eukprot:TRINITY_DN109610_c0_g1_i1.p1 TRINITY_DN109610_c0_g1~~TRINITY_DN109610_c0_g1_i1.p1  ORF type:complete len:283 (-),score=52.92 TRINITY_DN109610_c0_g1_i1:52-900(-)